jgi:hypothetical protein
MLISHKLAGVGQDLVQRYCSAALARAAEIQLASEPDAAGDLPGDLARLCALLTGHGPAGGLPREWSSMIDAADRTDGPRQHLDISDNLGGMYLSQFGGSTGHGDLEELTLKFLPRLSPLARALTLTFSGPPEQVTLEFRLPRPRE